MKMEALGYNISGKGQCYGFSQMAAQAFLANDMETFNQRLQIIHNMLVDEFENDFLVYREKVELAIANSTIVDILAFFDGIALNNRPYIYFHDDNFHPIAKKQNVDKTMPFTMPVLLESTKSSLSIVGRLIGAYDRENLQQYFDLLKEHLGDNSFTLNLIAMNHSITLGYNAEKGR